MLYGQHYYSNVRDSQNADCGLFKLITRTNRDIKDPACLHIIHTLQHPTSHQTTQSTQTKMVHGLKKNFLPLSAGK